MQKTNQLKRNNLIGISLVLVIALLYLCSQLLAPNLKKSRTEVATLKSDAQLAQAKVDSFPNAESQVQNLKDTIDRINLAVPAGRDVPSVLTSVEAIAVKNSVGLKSTQLKAVDSSGIGLGNSLAFSVNIITDYPHLVTFIQDIENNLRLMKVDTLSITPADQNSLNVSMDVETYSRDLSKE